MTIEKVIYNHIKKENLLLKFISEKTDIPVERMKRYLDGKEKMNCSEFIVLCSFLGLSIDDFRHCQDLKTVGVDLFW